MKISTSYTAEQVSAILAEALIRAMPGAVVTKVDYKAVNGPGCVDGFLVTLESAEIHIEYPGPEDSPARRYGLTNCLCYLEWPIDLPE